MSEMGCLCVFMSEMGCLCVFMSEMGCLCVFMGEMGCLLVFLDMIMRYFSWVSMSSEMRCVASIHI